MKTLACGVWGTSHWVLDWIGRGAMWCLPAKASTHDDEAYSLTGGAIVGALFGAALGFALSDQSHSRNLAAGTIIGTLLGISMGICCGAIVQSVDEYICTVLNSINSR